MNAKCSQGESQLYIFEDNEAVIKMIILRRSPTMRHVSRTHRVALDCLFDRLNLGTKIQIKYVDTKTQFANMLNKGSFSRDEWNHHLRLFTILNLSMFLAAIFFQIESTVSKRVQESTAKEQWRSRDL